MRNAETVQEIYAAFGRGDVPAILDRLAEDVAWEQCKDNRSQAAGVPWLAERRGHAGVTEFFRVAGGMGIRDFQVLSIMDGGDRVAAEIRIETERFRDEEIHTWLFDAAGKVTRMRHHVDTAKHIASARAAGATAEAA